MRNELLRNFKKRLLPLSVAAGLLVGCSPEYPDAWQVLRAQCLIADVPAASLEQDYKPGQRINLGDPLHYIEVVKGDTFSAVDNGVISWIPVRMKVKGEVTMGNGSGQSFTITAQEAGDKTRMKISTACPKK